MPTPSSVIPLKPEAATVASNHEGMTKKKIKMDLSLMNDCCGEDFQGAKQLVAFRSGP